MDKLKTKNAFIDTSIFYRLNFSFENSHLKRLMEYGQTSLELLITDITIKEIESNISKKVNEAICAYKEFKKDGMILRNSESEVIKGVFGFDNFHDIESELIKQFHTFLENADFTVVPTGGVNIEEVFERYFSSKPPFGEGKKKCEFPDAFVIAALEQWCKTEGEIAYVIACDGDFERACSNSSYLTHIQKLDELFDTVVKNDELLHKVVLEIVDSNRLEIEKAIENEFKEKCFILDDQDGIVEDIRVEKIEYEKAYIQFIAKNYTSVGIEPLITFTASVSYKDLDNAPYDKEEGDYLFWDTITTSIEKKDRFYVEIEFVFYEDNEEIPWIEKVSINEDQDIRVSIED